MTNIDSEKKIITHLLKLVQESTSSSTIKLDINQVFSSIGLNKKQLIALVFKKFDVKLSIQQLWEYPTIKSLAQFIAQQKGLVTKQNIEKISHQKLQKQSPIAVIGMACQFPGGAESVEEYWQMMLQGFDPIQEVPSNRWQLNEYYDSDNKKAGKMNTRFGGFLKNIEYFDAAFFNISPKEAQKMDPQQRIYLEVAWHALEDAALDPDELKNTSCGVFAGVFMHDYERYSVKNTPLEEINAYTNLGITPSAVAARLAYYLGTNGPSFAIDTACSSSLSAIYQACLALRAGDCDLAFAGGVNIILDPEPNIGYSKANMMASDGRCKTFDSKADGIVRSEGCGIVLLKRLDDAIRDGDRIHSVLKSVVANQDGASNGITAPNMYAQKALLEDALYSADLSADDIDLFETHGTGTYIGDPIEIDAINHVYATKKRSHPLILGAIKSQIGHAGAASGVAGVIKSILAIKNQKIPANLHFQKLNPVIDIDQVPCSIPTHTIKWDKVDKRRAAISSYGFTGTNTHVILEEYKNDKEIKESTIEEYIFILTAKSKKSLQALIKKYIKFLSEDDSQLIDICFTLAIGRKHFNHRIALEIKDKQHLIAELKNNNYELIDIDSIKQKKDKDHGNELIELFLSGKNVDWKKYYKSYQKSVKKIALPHYPFNKKRYWLELTDVSSKEGSLSHHFLLQSQSINFKDNTYIYTSEISEAFPSYNSHHKLFGNVVIAGASYLSALMSFAFNVLKTEQLSIDNIEFIHPLIVTKNEKKLLQIIIHKKASGYEFEVCSNANQEVITHAIGLINEKVQFSQKEISINKVLARCSKSYEIKSHIKRCAVIGLEINRHFHWLKSIKYSQQELLAELREPDDDEYSGHYLHPGLIDSSFQAGLVWLKQTGLQIPIGIESFKFCKRRPKWVYTQKNQDKQHIVYLDGNGFVVAEFEGFRIRQVDENKLRNALNKQLAIDYPCYIENYEEISVNNSDLNLDSILVYATQKTFNRLKKYTKDIKLTRLTNKGNIDLDGKVCIFFYENNFNQLVNFSKKCLAQPPSKFILVTNNASSINNNELIIPEQSKALGFWRSLILEVSNINCKCIDIDKLEDFSKVISLCSNTSLHEPELIVRDRFYVPRLVSKKIKNSAYVYDPNSTYLISGATGALGQALIKHLITSGVQQLVLLSRTRGDKEFEKKLLYYQKGGVSIRHHRVDCADKETLKNVLSNIDLKKLKGVFHTAGVVHDGLLANLSKKDFDDVFAAKIQGSMNLHQLTIEAQLECFVLFSSITSMLGNTGQTNYGAANAFMDALAIHRRQQGLVATSINWGPFAGHGMAAGLESFKLSQGITPLEISNAFSMMDKSLVSNEARVGVFKVDWSNSPYKNSEYLYSLLPSKSSTNTSWLDYLRQVKPEQRYQALTDKIRILLASLLDISQIDEIDTNKGFFDLGLDSLMAVELKNNLQDEIGTNIRLSNTVAFDYPSVNELANYLLEHLEVQQKPDAETIYQAKSEILEFAIIGMSGEFPGARNIKEFEELLFNGQSGISEIPKDRFNIDEYYDANRDAAGKIVTRKGGFIKDIDTFDNQFFSISPSEAKFIDPQQRLLLMHTWCALENAGIAADDLKGKDVGVFIGMAGKDYFSLINQECEPSDISSYVGTGNASSTASGRISYAFGLQGPSFTIDSACSSTLTALNEACQRINQGECSSAIVGGANALLVPHVFINYSKAGMLSADGECKTFDKDADGYVRGEGCGVFIIKSLSDAIANNDSILAIIKSSGVNQDGASSGLTVPNGKAQVKLLKRVLAKAKLKPHEIDYVECHGTGTSLGDPIEVNSLASVYGIDRKTPLRLGSVKTNIGHLEGAAGAASLVKSILAFKNKSIPKNLNFNQLNPNISADLPIEVVTRNTVLKSETNPCHIAISGNGFSGTNVHVILEEPSFLTDKDTSIALPQKKLFTLSAKTEMALKILIDEYIEHLTNNSISIDNLCYTLAIGRNQFKYRIALLVSSKQELLEKLKKGQFDETSIQPYERRIESSDIELIKRKYLQGYHIDWNYYYKPFVKNLSKIELLNYPFHRKSFWIDVDQNNKENCVYINNWRKFNPLNATYLSDSWHLITFNDNFDNSNLPNSWHCSTFNDISGKSIIKCIDQKNIVLLIDEKFTKNSKLLENYKQIHELILSLIPTVKKLCLITEYGQAVIDGDEVNPFASSLHGLWRSLRLEFNLIDFSYIDVDKNSFSWPEVLMTKSFVELAIRKNEFYQPSLNRVSTIPKIKDLNTNGTYVITGGLGALGLFVAKKLVGLGVNNICLLARNKPNRSSKKKIEQLKTLGATIEVVQCDVCNFEQVKQLFERINYPDKPLIGLIHAAGVLHDGLFTNLDWDNFREVLDPKVKGAINCHNASIDLKLEYFVLFSSMTSILGATAQTNYSMANAFLDGLAHYRSNLGLTALCINWGAWQDAGMNTNKNPRLRRQRQHSGMNEITSDEGLRLFNQVMTSDFTQVSIANIDWDKVKQQGEFTHLPSIQSLLPEDELQPEHRFITLKEMPKKVRRESLRTIIRQHLCEILGITINELDDDMGFFAMGMDSLMTLELQKRLQMDVGQLRQLNLELVYDYSTLNQLVDYFDKLLSNSNDVNKGGTDAPTQSEPIAIIGMAGLFPGDCNSPEELWQLIINNKSAIQEVPNNRWNIDEYFDANPNEPGKMYLREGGFIKNIEYFDADFFHISPKEAKNIDPQQRLLLQTGWHALEDAAINPEALRSSNAGIIVGARQSEYCNAQYYSGKENLNPYTASGGAMSALSGRFAYAYDFQGPTMTIDTACSSSLVAIHNACQALTNNDSNLMLAAGVNLTLTPDVSIALCRSNMLSQDGACKPFDERANGYVRSEGCAVIVLKRLSEALKDGDRIYATVLASDVKHHGATSGFTVPSHKSQVQLLQSTLRKAGLTPNDINYVEAHGTGTSVGDPIEIAAISDVFAKQRNSDNPLYISAIKANIGHLEAAAGIAGLIKVLLSFKHKIIPGICNLKQLNHKIQLDDSQIVISKQNHHYQNTNSHIAAVSSFGFSGINAHAILKSYSSAQGEVNGRRVGRKYLFLLSAKNKPSLSMMVESYINFLESTDEDLANICYTLAVGRCHFKTRIALVVSSTKELLGLLKSNNFQATEVELNISELETKSLNDLKNSFLAGETIDFDRYYYPYKKYLSKISLPNYVFDESYYWNDEISQSINVKTIKHHPFLEQETISLKDNTYIYTSQLDAKQPGFLSDHKIHGEIVVAGACYISALMSFALRIRKMKTASITELEFIQPLIINTEAKTTLQFTISDKGEYLTFEVHSMNVKSNAKSSIHAKGSLIENRNLTNEYFSIADLSKELYKSSGRADFYKHASQLSIQLGNQFQWLDEVYYNDTSILAKLRMPISSNVADIDYSPGMIDSIFQTGLVWRKPNGKLRIPISLTEINFSTGQAAWIFVSKELDRHVLIDSEGFKIAEFKGLKSRSIIHSTLEKITQQQFGVDNLVYLEYLEEIALPSQPNTVEDAYTIYASDEDFLALSGCSDIKLTKGITNNPPLYNTHVVYVFNNDFYHLLSIAKQCMLSNILSFTLVTKCALKGSIDEYCNPLHSQALGFIKSLKMEYSNHYCNHLDIDNISRLFSLLPLIANNQLPESMLVVRDKTYVVRLVNEKLYNKKHNRLAPPKKRQYLIADKGLEDLCWRNKKDEQLNDDAVEIKIEATSLNFRDILNAMQLYPGNAGDLGYECCGEVIAIGKKVSQFKVGEKVIVFGQGLFANERIISQNQCVSLPNQLTPAQGASIPVAYLSAYYALFELANLKSGQKILIHAASGGVGLAAIAFALSKRCKIFATASNVKQDYLRNTIGLTHVYDSRSTNFSQQILKDTNGEGVDIVINSLTGEGFVQSSLKCLSKSGVFIELSKINIYSHEKIQSLREDVDYKLLELDSIMQHNPRKVQNDLNNIINKLVNNKLALLPITSYPVTQLPTAFKTLKEAHHIGKVVVNHISPFSYKKDKTYLITGGNGGLANKLTQHLIENGAKHIVLISRSEAKHHISQSDVLQKHVSITHLKVDVRDQKALKVVFDDITASPFPLAGIFHTAGVLKDNLFAKLNKEDFEAVLEPKIKGAQNLDKLSRDLDIDCFVLFSSLSAKLGSVGQTNYSAANAYMDGMAILRRNLGLPALSINWGPFADVGMALSVRDKHISYGYKPLNSNIAFKLLDEALSKDLTNIVIVDCDWSKVPYRNNPYLNYLVIDDDSQDEQWISALMLAPQEAREQLLQDKLKQIAGKILQVLDYMKLDEDVGFYELGMDSLMIMDFRNKIQELVGKNISISNTLLFEKDNFIKLTSFIGEQIFNSKPNQSNDFNNQDLNELKKKIKESLKRL
jgi:acyl transferase domain-containing protein/NADPH:quinone reductase-like Zn-dependent oxidoreductase/acyl carrier protein